MNRLQGTLLSLDSFLLLKNFYYVFYSLYFFLINLINVLFILFLYLGNTIINNRLIHIFALILQFFIMFICDVDISSIYYYISYTKIYTGENPYSTIVTNNYTIGYFIPAEFVICIIWYLTAFCLTPGALKTSTTVSIFN